MPFRKPLKKPGKREPKYWHFIKLCWFKIHLDDVRNKISMREFCRNFFDLVVSIGIIEEIEAEFGLKWEWFDDEGNPETPDYDTLMSGTGTGVSRVAKYEWHEQYPLFKVYAIENFEKTELERYQIFSRRMNTHSIEIIERCNEKDGEFNTIEEIDGKDMTYYRNKNSETRINEETAYRRRVGIEDTTGKFKVDAEVVSKNALQVRMENVQRQLRKENKPRKRLQKKLKNQGIL